MAKKKETSLKKRSIVSTLSLFFQSGYSAVLGLAANIVLTIYLSPEIFGIYITVLSIIVVMNYFSDIGLAASLIQRDKIDDNDVKSAFTIQQVLVLTLVGIGFLLTGAIMKFYGLGSEGKFLFWMLLLSFYLSSLKTIPSVFLERSVHFQKLVMVQVLENTVFYITVIVLAITGHGLMSFAYGVIIRSVVGLVAIYKISFWMPQVGISKKSTRHLLTYGVPFQSMSFLAIFKDEIVNLFLGKYLGFEALGYIGWAKKWAESPLRIVMDNISRVVFPVFSRIQKDEAKQGRVIDKILKYQSMIMIPATLGLMILMPVIIEVLPKYEKWRPALPIFYIFVISSLFSSYSTPFINFFNGIGRVKLSLGFMAVWTVLTWVMIIPLSKAFGIYGFPLTVLILSMTFVVVILKAKTIVTFNFLRSTFPFMMSGALMAICVFVVRTVVADMGYINVFIIIGTGVIVYYGALKLLFRVDLMKEIRGEFRGLG